MLYLRNAHFVVLDFGLSREIEEGIGRAGLLIPAGRGVQRNPAPVVLINGQHHSGPPDRILKIRHSPVLRHYTGNMGMVMLKDAVKAGGRFSNNHSEW